MKNKYYLYTSPSTDPYYNLALEEYLLKHYKQGVLFMLWQNNNTVVVGRNQNTIEEVNLQFVEEHGITVVRRETGGGAVYHDLGNLNYSFIMDRDANDDNGMDKFSTPVIETLKELGANALYSGRNDILIDGCKVSGSAQRLYENRILHHGCMLYDTDLSMVGQALKVKQDKFRSKAVKSVRSRVGNMKDYLPKEMTLERFREKLIEHILQDSYEELVLSESEEEQIQTLRDEKYASWEWTFGKSMECAVHNYKRYEGGAIDVYVKVEKGYIKQCQIYGDFMALRPISGIAEKLVGCKYEWQSILSCLNQFDTAEYFGTITAAQAASCISCIDCEENKSQ